MTYNLGAAGIQSFTTFNSYISARNWAAAASDLQGTLWCRQVGSRCTRDSGIIAAGCGGSGSSTGGGGSGSTGGGGSGSSAGFTAVM